MSVRLMKIQRSESYSIVFVFKSMEFLLGCRNCILYQKIFPRFFWGRVKCTPDWIVRQFLISDVCVKENTATVQLHNCSKWVLLLADHLLLYKLLIIIYIKIYTILGVSARSAKLLIKQLWKSSAVSTVYSLCSSGGQVRACNCTIWKISGEYILSAFETVSLSWSAFTSVRQMPTS